MFEPKNPECCDKVEAVIDSGLGADDNGTTGTPGTPASRGSAALWAASGKPT